MNKVTDFFIRGQKDCKAGIEARSHNTDYLRGYDSQYHLEQSLAWKQGQQEKNNERN